MKKKINYPQIAIVFYIGFLLVLTNYLIIEFHTNQPMHILQRLIYALIEAVLLYAGSFCWIQGKQKNQRARVMRHTVRTMLGLYLMLILIYTLFDPAFGRHIHLSDWSVGRVIRYFHEEGNIVVFHTVSLYIQAYKEHTLTISDILMNVVGNLLVLMPMSVLVPLVFDNLKKAGSYFIWIGCFAAMIEILQGVLMCGAPDIDDWLLNVSGSMICYALTRTKGVQQWIDKVTFHAFQ